MTSTKPKVSIIIPNWDGAKYLPTCFNALEKQTYPNLETIMVDNASSDESVALTKTRYPWVKIIQLPKNLGLTGALNRVLTGLKGKSSLS
jgi:hypothetical protein